jgi:hypothetical protein
MLLQHVSILVLNVDNLIRNNLVKNKNIIIKYSGGFKEGVIATPFKKNFSTNEK